MVPLKIPGYDILDKVADGGMGEVYRARPVRGGSAVAIKVLREGQQLVDAARTRFEREVALLTRVSHTNIVALLDQGWIEGRPYFAMEYVEGTTLRRLLDGGRPVPVERAVRILRSLAAALAHLHEAGIVHRDLKPENVLLDAGENVKVADFGISAPEDEIGDLTRSGQFFGTVDYMAPEQRHRLPLDHRADQYSLAVVAYEMLTGQKPAGVFKPPSQLNARLGRDADRVVMRALQKYPEDRYESIAEFDEALQATLARAARRQAASSSRALRIVVTVTAAAAVISALLYFIPRPVRPQSPQELAVIAGVEHSLETILEAQERVSEVLTVERRVRNTIGMEFALVPPGEFWMGTDSERLERFHEVANARLSEILRSETPRHRVRLTRPFYLGVTEVTLETFRRFVDDTGYRTEADRGGLGGERVVDGRWRNVPGCNWSNTWADPQDTQPAGNVSWEDAVAFCDWLSETEQRRYRLPTEAEWEYACRAGGATLWVTGDDTADLGDYVWFEMPYSTPFPNVAMKQPNRLGLFDMNGNVAEWCQDWFAPYAARLAEPASIDPDGPPEGSERVVRGGVWVADSTRVRPAFRFRHPPAGTRIGIGFRVVLELAAGQTALRNPR